MELSCPHCKHIMNNYEINNLWCTNCNAKFSHLGELVGDPLKSLEYTELTNRIDNMLLSTTNTLDGYVVKRYIDVINADVLFKASFGDQIVNFFNTVIDIFSFSEKELTSNADILSKANEYVRKKLIYKAAKAGANAVIGIDFETNISDTSYARVSMNGTAVYVVPSNYEELETKRLEEQLALEKKNLEESENRKKAIIDFLNTKYNGEPLVHFFDRALSFEKYRDIEALWIEMNLNEVDDYAKLNEVISQKAMIEKMYGSRVNDVQEHMNKWSKGIYE